MRNLLKIEGEKCIGRIKPLIIIFRHRNIFLFSNGIERLRGSMKEGSLAKVLCSFVLLSQKSNKANVIAFDFNIKWWNVGKHERGGVEWLGHKIIIRRNKLTWSGWFIIHKNLRMTQISDKINDLPFSTFCSHALQWITRKISFSSSQEKFLSVNRCVFVFPIAQMMLESSRKCFSAEINRHHFPVDSSLLLKSSHLTRSN